MTRPLKVVVAGLQSRQIRFEFRPFENCHPIEFAHKIEQPTPNNFLNTMKITLSSILSTLIFAAATQASPVLRGLKSCTAGCAATYTACIRVPGADKRTCLATKKSCDAACKSGGRALEETDPRAICIDACAQTRNTCNKTAKGSAKKLCAPAFKTCTAAC
jgi:hypothetical protein